MDAGEYVAGNSGGSTGAGGKARSAAVQEAMPVAQLGLGPAQTGG
jgi:hypothetical protein